MKKRILAVCDLEEAYACSLTEYINEKKNTPFEVQAFTNIESLAEFARENHIELLLISTDAMCDEIKNLNIERTIILSDGELPGCLEEEPQVYKYQSSDTLVAEIMNYCAETGTGLTSTVLTSVVSSMDMIGVYSPLGRVGKTSFALALGEVLAENRKVLYLNLEEFSGFETIFSQIYRADISDLIYFARQKEGNLIYKLNGIVQSFYNLDYIPPAFSPWDLRDVQYEEWIRFIQEIGACGEYDTVILDLGSQIDEVFRILLQCRRIYMPVQEDDISRAKLLQFEKNLRALDCQDALEKVQRLHLPECRVDGKGTDFIENLLKSSMGNYVRRLLTETEGVYGYDG